MSRVRTWAWRGAVLALLASIWWQVGGGDWLRRGHAKLQNVGKSEEPTPGGGSVLDAGQDAAMRDLEKRAREEAAAASAASR